ncbi:hypothetical protein E2C01_028416 [Portunus trituberculatus]|uniref:Uncharacterized protein n=1 Tax=Portunus trituberculatus TaxID=210409 RepID=A0A5B7EPE8_PORTR|nr:hypothetical protein [Portunus trituberculatus]
MREPVPLGLMQRVNINTDTYPTHNARQVQFSYEDFKLCSAGASQDYPHGFNLNKLQRVRSWVGL